MKQIGRYEIQGELGRGAMGIVYAAIDPIIGRQVAIKTIRLGALEVGADRAELTQRLHREARAAGVLSHPGIITVFDVGEQGEDAYIVMEFIEGRTVDEMLASGIPQRSGMLLSILRKAADALDYAHAKGIIHRDIKPSNIMICSDGTVKIADFGVAKLTASTSLTQSGFVLGTPSYMSPEQVQGSDIDGNSDQFSLAVVAYRMLTGKLPFEGPSLTALFAKILLHEPEYESAGLTPPVRSVFGRALRKNPRQRYTNCTGFINELENAYTGSKVEALNTMPLMTKQDWASADIPVTMGAAESEVTRKVRGNYQPSSSIATRIVAQAPKRKSFLIPGMISIGVLVLALIAFLVIRSMHKPASSVPKISTENVTIPNKETAEIVLPPEPVSQLPKQEKAVIPQPLPVRLDSSKTVSENAAPKPKRSVASASQQNPSSGVITWSGILEKNSILVITEQGATIGNVTGHLPGKPIQVEVEPKDLIIRQLPGVINDWKRMILYSANKQYSSITIRWQVIK
jgi:serine/threonine protein kinase